MRFPLLPLLIGGDPSFPRPKATAVSGPFSMMPKTCSCPRDFPARESQAARVSSLHEDLLSAHYFMGGT
jgi:hypothetical protein